MALFSKSSNGLLGIDVGSSAVKVVELSRKASGEGYRYRVERFAVAPLPEGAVEGKLIANPDAVSVAIKEAVRRSGSSSKQAASCVSSATVISRVVNLPAGISEAEMESLVELEADQYIPQRIDEVRYDFDVLGPVKEVPDMVEVLLVASRGDVVEDLMAAVELANIEPVIVDVEPYAIEHCFQMLGDDSKDKTVAVIDVGESTMDVYVLENDTIIYTREYNFGGKLLTDEIRKRYGMESQEAETAKVQGELPEGYLEEVVAPFSQMLVQEVRGALQIYQAGGKGGEIEKIYLAGGCGRIPGLTDLAQQVLGVPVAVFDPFDKMEHNKSVHINRMHEMAPAMVVACGLALRRFD